MGICDVRVFLKLMEDNSTSVPVPISKHIVTWRAYQLVCPLVKPAHDSVLHPNKSYVFIGSCFRLLSNSPLQYHRCLYIILPRLIPSALVGLLAQRAYLSLLTPFYICPSSWRGLCTLQRGFNFKPSLQSSETVQSSASPGRVERERDGKEARPR
jgi:hypothetical protein